MFARAEVRLRGTSRAGPLKLRNVAVEFAFLRNVLFLLGRHFRGVLAARHTARSKFPASDLVPRKSLVLPPIALHLSPPMPNAD